MRFDRKDPPRTFIVGNSNSITISDCGTVLLAADEQVTFFSIHRFGRGFYHCHEVKEVLIEDAKKKGEWDRRQAWRFPLPDNLGLFLCRLRRRVLRRSLPVPSQ